jgi:predicted dehydrogenase
MGNMNITRRTFVAGAAAASMASRVMGANDRLRIGVIGCGGQATAHMRTLVKMRESDNAEIGAVCDVFDKRATKAAELTSGKIAKHYHDILNNKDIDYVLIATPEHWHYQMIIDTLAAGKHVYCEKPMTHGVEQAKAVVAKVAASKVKMQVGVQGMSDESYAEASKYVKNGTLGKVVIAQIDYSRNQMGDFWAYDIDADARPGENLDWKEWLGPAPKRPWDPDRFFRWRRYWDYSSGIASDLFIHRISRIIRALELGMPERAVGTGGTYEFTNSKAEIPDTFNVMLDYKGGPTVMLVSSLANDTKIEHVLRGHKATLEFTSTGFTITPQKLFAKEMEPITYTKTGAESLDLHHRNLMAAIRTGEALKCDAAFAYKGLVACEMGVKSFRERKYLGWDAAKEKIVKL